MTDVPKDFLSPEVPEKPKELLEEEENLWNALMMDPGNDDAHKAYFNFSVRNGLLKEASRRYAVASNEKESSLSIEVRRQFRRYHQAILNLMFMASTPTPAAPKKSALVYFTLASAAILIFAGLLIAKMRFALLIGLGIIVGYFVYNRNVIKAARDANRRFPE